MKQIHRVLCLMIRTVVDSIYYDPIEADTLKSIQLELLDSNYASELLENLEFYYY